MAKSPPNQTPPRRSPVCNKPLFLGDTETRLCPAFFSCCNNMLVSDTYLTQAWPCFFVLPILSPSLLSLSCPDFRLFVSSGLMLLLSLTHPLPPTRLSTLWGSCLLSLSLSGLNTTNQQNHQRDNKHWLLSLLFLPHSALLTSCFYYTKVTRGKEVRLGSQWTGWGARCHLERRNCSSA